ncbi:MAG TPA: hypothetical protein VMD97_01850 [Candidatus Aquilonibacter sp.]|nr:hypothetical protein [Candidatus Aquilonibacter sp.]
MNLFDFVPEGELDGPFASLPTRRRIEAPPSPAPQPAPFDGPEYVEPRDRTRLATQIDCIREHALDGKWRTIQKLTAELRKAHPRVGFPENSVQAQLRNLRKLGYRVERRHVAKGLFEYRLLEPVNPGVAMAMQNEVAA